MIISDFLFLGVEADALADDSGFGAGSAPDREGHFEADCEDALTGFACTRAEGMLAGELVGGGRAFVLWRDITSHIWNNQRVSDNFWGGAYILKPCILAVGETQASLEGEYQDFLSLVWEKVWREMLGESANLRQILNVDPKRSRARRSSINIFVVAPKLEAQSTTQTLA